MVRHDRLTARFVRAGYGPGTKKTPQGVGGLRGGKSPVALVDNDGGGSHNRPCVAHESSVAGPSTIWLPVSKCGHHHHILVGTSSRTRHGAGLDEGVEQANILTRPSGCHCTASRNRDAVCSLASSVPSCAQAAGR